MNKTLSTILYKAALLTPITILFFTLYILGPQLIRSKQMYSDFFAFHTAAKLVASPNYTFKDLYNTTIQKEVQKEALNTDLNDGYFSYLNPPILALLFLPLSGLNIEGFYQALTIINSYVLSAVILILTNEDEKESTQKSKAIRLLYGSLLLFFFPLLGAALHAQITIMLTLVLVTVYMLLKKEKDVWAGVLASLLLLKPHYILLIPFLILLSKKRVKFTLGFASSTAVLVILSFLLSGKALIYDYPQLLGKIANFQAGRAFGTEITNNLNLQPVVPYLVEKFDLGERSAFIIVTGVSLGLYLLLLFLAYQKVNRVPKEFILSSGIIFALTLNIHTFFSDLVMLIIPLYFYLIYFFEKRKIGAFIIFLSIFLVPSTFTFIPQVLIAQALLITGVCGLLFIGGRSR